MSPFRFADFHGLGAVTPQDLASLGADHDMTWRGDGSRKRQHVETAADIPALPTSLASEAVSPLTLLPKLAAAPTATPIPTSNGARLLVLSGLALLPIAEAAAPAATSAAGGGLLGLGVGATLGGGDGIVGGLLGGGSTPATTQEAAASTSIPPVPTSTAPETSTVAPTGVPVSTAQPVTTSQASATSAAQPNSEPTTQASASQAATSSAQPVTASSSAINPVQQSSSTDTATVPDGLSSATSSVQASSHSQVSSVSSPDLSSSAKQTSIDDSSTFATVSSITVSAAADISIPTIASSILTSVTKTGSALGNAPTGSGITVSETAQSTKNISPGTMAIVIVGAVAGGLLIAALMLFFVRKGIRISRIAKAESPPPSPLLNASNPPMSSAPPLRIEVGMHQRMRSNDSDFWMSGKGSSIEEKEVEGHGYPIAIGPLPSLREESGMNAEMGRPDSGRNVSDGGLKAHPIVGRSGGGGEAIPREW